MRESHGFQTFYKVLKYMGEDGFIIFWGGGKEQEASALLSEKGGI